MKIMKKIGITILFCSAILCGTAQERLVGYIQHGLDHNQVLIQKNLSVSQATLALKNAKSLLLPSASFLADYTSAQGGRLITVPAGDLMNPVYSYLNQQGTSHKFPQISNLNEQLLPNNFYDARIHITYPVLNSDVRFNRKISSREAVRQQYDADAFRQQLIKDIKQAYYRYCAISNAVRIYENARELVVLNVKQNQSLLDNGRGLPANLLRSQSEREDLEAKIIDGENQRLNARNYLNFLVARPLADTVLEDELKLPDSLTLFSTDTPDIRKRSELKSMEEDIGIAETMIKMDKSFAIPKLNAYLDGGSQESNFKVSSTSRYYLVGAQLSVPIFAGGRNRNLIHIAELNLESRRLQKDLLTNQLLTAANAAQNNLVSAVSTLHANEKRLVSAKAYFKLIDKGFREGVNTLIEFIDAREQLTAASLQLNIAQYTILSQIAEYEWQTASSKIK
jgi:outer membrane protein TolC